MAPRPSHHAIASPVLIFDGRYIQDRYHGIGRYAFHLIRELSELMPDQSIHVLYEPAALNSRFDWSELNRWPNLTVVGVRAPVFRMREQIELPRVLRQAGHALYHTPYFALPWLLQVPAIITVHDCIFEHNSRHMPFSWAYVYYRLLMRLSLARATHIVVPSRATAADIARFYHAPMHTITVTPEAADGAFTPITSGPALASVRHRYRLPDRFVLAVGMRRPHKNFATLVQAVGLLPDAHLVFIGEADERFPDTTANAARQLSDRVHFLGKVPDDDLPPLYNLATVLACPSLIEGFGLPVLEAMACGTPVICSDIPVLREVAGDAALFVPPSDIQGWATALTSCLADAAHRAHLSHVGLARARSFSWRQAAAAMLPVYQHLGLMTDAAPRTSPLASAPSAHKAHGTRYDN